ncbi:MAG: hypothetical protein JWM68_5288 [Verrucomicrobiales bacterium]|nr:hypothetical protein [Verrucomicrobiales bacterium]
MRVKISGMIKGILSIAVFFTFVSASLASENVFVSSYNGNVPTTDVVPCPLSCPTGSVSVSGSTAYSTAFPAPPAAVRKTRYGTDTDAVWSITPTDIDLPSGSVINHYSSLQAPSIYEISITMPTVTGISSDLVVNMTCTGGSVGPQAVPVTAFRSSSLRNVWLHVGYITNDIPNPTITFTYASGTINNSTARWFMDTVRFTPALDCGCCADPGNPSVAGPLFAGQTSVVVTNVNVGVTNITVYANGNSIGSTNYAPGFAAGSVTVSTTALIEGWVLRARQTKAGCSSLIPSTGSIVQSFIKLNLSPEKQAGISINGVVGHTYEIQSATDLISSNWISMTNLTLQQTNELWIDTRTNLATNTGNFYRVLLVP